MWQSNDSLENSPPKTEGRTIYYHVADDNGNVDDSAGGQYFTLKENGVFELTRRLEEETGLEDIIVCSRSNLNGKLYPLRLQLPPNNATMHVIVIQASSKGEYLLLLSFAMFAWCSFATPVLILMKIRELCYLVNIF